MNKIKNHDFVEITDLDPSIIIDLVYATADNFTKQIIYPATAKAYLRKPVAQALVRANAELQQQGYNIKVFDAYRPFSIQEKLWAVFPNEKYIFKPVRNGSELLQGSRHSKGTAVDITMIDLSTDKEVAMPSEFDEFNEKAHRDYQQASINAIQNREFLEQLMHKHGFIGWPYEWWHFDWHEHESFTLSDLPISDD